MSISEMVQHSDPNDAARAALSAAKSILADTSAPEDARKQAQQLIDFADTNDIAATLRGQRIQAADAASTTKAPPEDAARADLELFFNGPDLIVKLAGYGASDAGVDFVVNGTRIEVKTTGAEPYRVLHAIDVQRPVIDADITATRTDDGVHVVRLRQFKPDEVTNGGRQWFGLKPRRR